MDREMRVTDATANEDMSASLLLDGNAAAGLLDELFGREMTVAHSVCDHCGAGREVGSLYAYMYGPGVVLRCPSCANVVLRLVRTETHYWFDARGATSLRLIRG
jgi:hypothetical protein